MKLRRRAGLKDWLIVLLSLADDVAAALLVLLVLWLFKVPITPPVIVALVIFIVAFALIMHRAIIPAIRRRKVSGAEGMLGLEGEVVEALSPQGSVKVKDEYWRAQSVEGEVPAGERVEVLGVEGLLLKVKRKRQ